MPCSLSMATPLGDHAKAAWKTALERQHGDAKLHADTVGKLVTKVRLPFRSGTIRHPFRSVPFVLSKDSDPLFKYCNITAPFRSVPFRSGHKMSMVRQ